MASAESTKTAAGAAPESLAVLESLARGAGVPFDPLAAERALRRTEMLVPPTAPRAARQRLTMAAETLNLQILTRHLTPREAVRAAREMPLAIFAVGSEGAARWHVLTEGGIRRGHLLALGADQADRSISASELAELVGAADADTVLEWLIAQPASPISGPPEPGTGHDSHGHGPSPLTRVFKLLWVEWRDILIVVIYSIAIGLLSLAVPLTAMAVVNTVALATLTQQLIVLCIVLAVALIMAAGIRALQTIVVEFIQQRVFVRVVADLAYRLPRVELTAFDRNHGPELVNRFFDVLTVQKAAATLLLDGVAIALQTVIGLILLAAYHEVLLGFDLILIGALALIIFILGRGGVRTSIAESRSKYEVAGWMEELARNPAAFKIGGGPHYAFERADQLTRKYLVARQSHFLVVLRQYFTALLLQALASAVLLGLGGYLVIEGQLSLGQLVASEIVVTLVVASFTKMGKHLESYYDLLAATDKLGHLMDLPLERAGGIAHVERGEGASVVARNVGFHYDGNRSILDHFDLEIAAGERVALLGPNGAGKTTLVELLFGMRAPNTGHIQIDENDIRDLSLESLRSHVAIVRGLEVFDGTLIENVRMGREELTVADVREALQAVRLLDDILDFPDGMQTRLSAGGRPLSLGQSERLMLARAIVGQPRLLVLDEVLDDMDRSVREDVLPAILGPTARWTLLVVTHSPEVAALCGRQIRMQRPRP